MDTNTANQALELTLAIERCQAVIQSFADEYVDVSDKDLYQSIMMRTNHYCTLFSVIANMIDDIRIQAATLEGTISGQ